MAGAGSASIGQRTIYRCLHVSAGSTGEEEPGGLGVLDEGRGRRETPARQSCMCRMKGAVCREEALQALTESSPGPRLPDGP